MYALRTSAAISGKRGGAPVKDVLDMAFGTAIGISVIACPPVGIPAAFIWGLYWMWRLR